MTQTFEHTCEPGETTGISECCACAVRDCPLDEPLHYHHDGCPVCDVIDAPPLMVGDARVLSAIGRAYHERAVELLELLAEARRERDEAREQVTAERRRTHAMMAIGSGATRRAESQLALAMAWGRELVEDRDRLVAAVSGARYCLDVENETAARACLAGMGLEDGIREEWKGDLDQLRGALYSQGDKIEHARFMAAGWRRLAQRWEDGGLVSDAASADRHTLVSFLLRATREMPTRARVALEADLEATMPGVLAAAGRGEP